MLASQTPGARRTPAPTSGPLGDKLFALMASIGHVAVGRAVARLRANAGGARVGAGALAGSMLLWSGLSMLPDADVIGFAFGVRYGDPWGHRGATHSFVFS